MQANIILILLTHNKQRMKPPTKRRCEKQNVVILDLSTKARITSYSHVGTVIFNCMTIYDGIRYKSTDSISTPYRNSVIRAEIPLKTLSQVQLFQCSSVGLLTTILYAIDLLLNIDVSNYLSMPLT
jgi:hypothetical protein